MGQTSIVEPGVQDVVAASKRIRKELYPVIPRPSDSLSVLTQRDVWVIPECLQRTGSFKFRGALNRMLLHAEHGGGPVITASSGNHAIGLTIAAGIAGIESTVIVPESVSLAKLERLRSLGANVLIMGNGFDEAEDRMYRYAEQHDLEIVNSFDPEVIAGHGTVALDAFKHVPDLDLLLAPVASGGLISGCAIVAKAVNPDTRVSGVQTGVWPAMQQSIRAGEIVDVSGGDTIADGLAGNATRSDLPFQIISRDVDDIFLVNDSQILGAIHHGLVHEGLVLEGAGAATLAAVLSGVELPGSGPIGVILSGGNCAEDVLKQALDLGYQSGR